MITELLNLQSLRCLTLGGHSSVKPSDPGRFHRALILQDFQYVNQGWTGYRHNHTLALRGSIAFNNALKSLHSILFVSRSFTTSPYTATREFVGDYIIVSAVEHETKSNSWQATLIASKGINIWNGVVNLRAFYIKNHSTMLQNDQPTEYDSETLNARTSIDFSFWKDMHLRYGLAFSQSRMKMDIPVSTPDIRNWKHDLSLIIPVHPLTFDFSAEYYRNGLTDGNHKDFFLTDIKASYKSRHIDLSLLFSNLFNQDTYSYVIASDLIRRASTNSIRGREIILSIYYKF